MTTLLQDLYLICEVWDIVRARIGEWGQILTSYLNSITSIYHSALTNKVEGVHQKESTDVCWSHTEFHFTQPCIPDHVLSPAINDMAHSHEPVLATHTSDMTVKRLCINLHFFCGLVSAMNIILGHYNLIILLELMVWIATLRV